MTASPDTSPERGPILALCCRLMTASRGQTIRTARQARRLSQDQLAELAQVSSRSIRRVEHDEIQDPAILGALERVLRIGSYAEVATGPTITEASTQELLHEVQRRLLNMERELATRPTVRVSDELPPTAQPGVTGSHSPPPPGEDAVSGG